MSDTTKMFHIMEYDLAVLEAELPRLMDETVMSCNNPMTRKRWEIVKEILCNIRWDYGPPTQVEKIG